MNALTVFDPNNTALPAHIAAAQAELGSNIPDKQTVPSLSYEGKVWAIVLDGNKTKLTRPNGDGDQEPVTVFKAVILNSAARRGRSFYEGAYDPGKTSSPRCWSTDGIIPSPHVPLADKQAPKCDACPRAIKGSKVTENGKATTECSTHRMLALVPSFKMDFEPLRLKIAVTSDYDKELVDHGWFAFQQYVDYLKSRGISNTALVVTKIKFDPNVAYPKLLFAVDRYTSPDEIELLKPVVNSERVEKLIGDSWTPAGVDGVSTADSAAAATQAAAQVAETKPAAAVETKQEAPASRQVIDAEYTELVDEALGKMGVTEPAEDPQVAALKAQLAALEAANAKAPTPTPAATAADQDDEAVLAAAFGGASGGAATQAATTPAPTPAPTPAVSASVPADVADLLSNWGGG